MIKATIQPPAISVVAVHKSWLTVYSDLFKARLTFLVLLTTLVGFYLGSRAPVNYTLMVHTFLGTALVAAGASALNQWWERDYDAKMRRTQDRPLPSGRMRPLTVMGVGCVSAIFGLVYLVFAANLIASLLGGLTLATYLFIYTPLKRMTWLNTAAGAISGGLPPLVGWTAAQGRLVGEAWVLFSILALWQLPHFMAIAWIYRDDYARAGFKMLPSADPGGRRTGLLAFAHAMALVPASLCPSLLGLTGPGYFVGALGLGLALLWYAVRFNRDRTALSARQLYVASIAYLPLLLALMVMDKIR